MEIVETEAHAEGSRLLKEVCAMKKLLTAAGLAGLLAMVAVAAVLMTGSGGSLAVPAEVPGGVGPIHVITRDGRMFTFPEVAVTCRLAGFKEDSDEPVYACPVPYDINALVSDENTGRTDGSAADTIVTAYGYASGLPSGQWRTMQVYYGYTFGTPPNVALGPTLDYGETGHIENITSSQTTRGVFRSYFYYRAKVNSSGYIGTEWIAIG
jgi:hypothetical protein